MSSIVTNTAANSALRYLSNNSTAQSSSVSKLSSGSRITSAADDASGLAVGTKIKSDVTALKQAATNASNGSSILQAADGGMARIGDILQRMKSLATQSMAGTVGDNERAYIDAEYQQLIEEIDGIATGTRFNDNSLLTNTGAAADATDWQGGVTFVVGSNVSDTITVTITAVDSTALALNATDVGTETTATAAITALDTAISDVSKARANVGAQISRFDYHGQMIETSIENQEAIQSSIMDVDVASEQTKLSNAEVLTQAAIAALGKANEMPSQLLSLLR
ncbi:flagellin [Azospirillum sp. RU38E]|nr:MULTISPECIES: flagellin [unclassified Azospirillum]SNS52881.1 flagellin [Azospirillum sp. RU38E]SNS72867.1 flagellin [Azospirillum sp. RU37A]